MAVITAALLPGLNGTGELFAPFANPALVMSSRSPDAARVGQEAYEVLYEIENGEIIIYAIYHCARAPEVWKRRRDT